jgi:branched-chain amino acid transport system substrate-binding protein
MKNRNLIIVVVLVALAGGMFYAVKRPTGEAATTLLASLNIPLTGPISFPTKSFQEAALFAMEDLSRTINPLPFELQWNDNTAKPATAATLAQQQSQSTAALFYIGYGAELEASVPVLEGSGKPIFAFSFQASATKHPLVYRNIVSYKSEAPVFVEYAKKRKAQKIAAIYHDLPDTNEQFKQLVFPQLIASGIAESNILVFAHSLDRPDFRSLAAKVKAAAPDLIYISGFQNNLVPMIEALRVNGLIGDGNVIGTFAVLDLLSITSKESLNGIAVAIPSFMLTPSSRAQEFQRKFEERFKRRASFNEFCGYDFILIMNDLAVRLGPNPTAQEVQAAVAATDFEGVSGRIHFDSEGDAIYPTGVAVFDNGLLRTVITP